MMKVLAVSSEIYPLIKTGGLADVVGALPMALALHDVQVRTLVPGYPAVISAMGRKRVAAKFDDLFGGSARLLAAKVGDLDLIVLDAPHLYNREGGPYGDAKGKDWPDNWQRFAALSFVGSELAHGRIKDYWPDIIHAHDWQAGLTPAYLAFGGKHQAKSVFSVHNLAFQGQFDAKIFDDLRLPKAAFSMDGVEYYGGVGFLKAGLQCADALTTVSPTYAREIRTPEFGMGLDGLLNARADRLSGILNGIDLDAWDPGDDPALVRCYKLSSVKRREENKAALQAKFGLEANKNPLFGVVSRLTWQKGIDILGQSVDHLVSMGGQLCVLGSGDAELEAVMAAAVRRHPRQVGLIKGYDEDLSHLIQGGVDAVLVPSRFEPCGLTQLIGLRYGAVPVVARTGGLADTVIDANNAAIDAGVATGVQFVPDSLPALIEGLSRTIKLFRQPKIWAQIQRRGMKADVSWENSAKVYVALYEHLLDTPTNLGSRP